MYGKFAASKMLWYAFAIKQPSVPCKSPDAGSWNISTTVSCHALKAQITLIQHWDALIYTPLIPCQCAPCEQQWANKWGMHCGTMYTGCFYSAQIHQEVYTVEFICRTGDNHSQLSSGILNHADISVWMTCHGTQCIIQQRVERSMLLYIMLHTVVCSKAV